jgi:hypothetical protein
MEFLDEARLGNPQKSYSIHNYEQAYMEWIGRLAISHGKRHPKDMGEAEISQYVSPLATDGDVAASTQNQALSAIVFLYRNVVKIDLGDFGHMERA